MNLTEAIDAMRGAPSPDNSKAFADLFRKMTEDNVQVYTTAAKSGSGYAIDTIEHAGNVFCIMYSERGKLRPKQGSSTCTIGVSNLIDSAYSNPHIAGVAINPYDYPVYIQRKDLQMLSGKEDPRLKKRDWGEGIPEYTETDIMVAEEALDFAMEIVAEYGLAPEKFNLLESNNGLTTFPNFVAEKNGRYYFIAVDVAVAPNVPRINDEAVPKLIEIAKRNGNARILYAPVSIASADSERMQKGLALAGDTFIGSFLGFIEVEYDVNE